MKTKAAPDTEKESARNQALQAEARIDADIADDVDGHGRSGPSAQSVAQASICSNSVL